MAEPARTGRENQRYDGDTRLVAGCLPVLPDGRVILIGSLHRTDWILPKGGWEYDETNAQAAVREAYEEAGVRGAVTADLGWHEIVSSRGNKSRAAMFVLSVTEVLDDWPERRRQRKVIPFREAFDYCVRPEVISVLQAAQPLYCGRDMACGIETGGPDERQIFNPIDPRWHATSKQGAAAHSPTDVSQISRAEDFRKRVTYGTDGCGFSVIIMMDLPDRYW